MCDDSFVVVVTPLKVIMLPKRATDSTQNPRTGHEKPRFKLSVRIVQVTRKTIQIIDVAHGCISEIKGKSLMLKTLHIVEMGLGRMELALTWKPPS